MISPINKTPYKMAINFAAKASFICFLFLCRSFRTTVRIAQNKSEPKINNPDNAKLEKTNELLAY